MEMLEGVVLDLTRPHNAGNVGMRGPGSWEARGHADIVVLLQGARRTGSSRDNPGLAYQPIVFQLAKFIRLRGRIPFHPSSLREPVIMYLVPFVPAVL